MKNTKDNGKIRILIYKTSKGTFEGIVYEFGIIEEMEDQELLYYSLMEAAQLHIELAKAGKIDEKHLNCKVPNKYEKLWQDAVMSRIMAYFAKLTEQMIENTVTPKLINA